MHSTPAPSDTTRHTPRAQRRQRRINRLAALGAALMLLSLLLACSGPDDSDGEDPTATGGNVDGVTGTSTGPTSDPNVTPSAGDATDTPGVPGNQTPADPAATTPAGEPTTPAAPGETPTSPEGATETPAVAPTNTTTPPQTWIDPAQANVTLEPVGSGFSQPAYLTEIPDNSGRLIVLEKTGALRFIDGGMFLDLSPRVIQTAVEGYEHEQGMLGLAFHPQFATNGQFFVHYNDLNGEHVIARYRVGADGLGDINSEEVLMTYPQPEVNFQGGQLLFGPDGYLYIGTGTGGTAVELQLQAQELNNIYGKILRIDVNTTGPNGEAYGIPADNPFVSTPGARTEIWAYGLRNPWRFAFDRATGDLYSGGPGQFTRDWINVQPANLPAGQNHAWPIYEGLLCWADWPGECTSEGLLMPVIDFPTYEGGHCVIIGGVVAREAAPDSIEGAYVFGDFCSGRIYITGRGQDGTWLGRTEVGNAGGYIGSFGEDLAGNIYVLEIENGNIFRIVEG